MSHLILRRFCSAPLVARVAATLLTVGFTSAAQAQVYNATNDFSITNGNPNGVWQYGYASTLGGSITLLNAPSTSGIFNRWLSSTLNASDTPTILKNTSTTATQFGIAPGQLSLHPGPSPDATYTVLRFIAPTASSYTFSAQFFIGDSGDTDATILHNATILGFAPTTNINPLFTQTLTLNQGDRLDFAVGNKGSFNSDNTPVNIVITTNNAAAPEPGSLALLLPVIGVVGVMDRRRRKK